MISWINQNLDLNKDGIFNGYELAWLTGLAILFYIFYQTAIKSALGKKWAYY